MVEVEIDLTTKEWHEQYRQVSNVVERTLWQRVSPAHA